MITVHLGRTCSFCLFFFFFPSSFVWCCDRTVSVSARNTYLPARCAPTLPPWLRSPWRWSRRSDRERGPGPQLGRKKKKIAAESRGVCNVWGVGRPFTPHQQPSGQSRKAGRGTALSKLMDEKYASVQLHIQRCPADQSVTKCLVLVLDVFFLYPQNLVIYPCRN